MSHKKKKKYVTKINRELKENKSINSTSSKKKVLDGVDLIQNINNQENEENVINKEENINFSSNENENNDEINSIQQVENEESSLNLEANDSEKEEIIEENLNINEKISNQLPLDNHIEPIVEPKKTFYESIQSFISILFTVIIFIALVLLVFVIYNNYIKKEEKVYSQDEIEEICKDYIKKDYNIEEDYVSNYIRSLRGILYPIMNYSSKNITNDILLEFATYFIWGQEGEYLACEETDLNCLVSKKEMTMETLKFYFKKYLNLDEFNLNFSTSFKDTDEIRLYQLDDKIILSFSEFEYETLKHDVIDISIDEDVITIIMALSKKNTENLYSYAGSKRITLNYLDNQFIINKIETSLNS